MADSGSTIIVLRMPNFNFCVSYKDQRLIPEQQLRNSSLTDRRATDPRFRSATYSRDEQVKLSRLCSSLAESEPL